MESGAYGVDNLSCVADEMLCGVVSTDILADSTAYDSRLFSSFG